MAKPFQPSLPLVPFVCPFDTAVALRRVTSATTLTLCARLVWTHLATYAFNGPQVWPSKDAVAAAIGVDDRTVRIAFQQLAAAGFLKRVGRHAKTKTLVVQLEAFPAGAPLAASRSRNSEAHAQPETHASEALALDDDNQNRIPGSAEQGVQRIPDGCSDRIPGSAELRISELDRSSSSIRGAGEEEEVSLRSPEAIAHELADELVGAWPGSTREQRIEALLVGSEKTGKNGRPFVDMAQKPRALREAAARHLVFTAKRAAAGQLDVRELGQRGSPARPRPAPAPDPWQSVGADELAAGAEGLAMLRGSVRGAA